MIEWLPLLCDGGWGICGWIPVSKNGVLYVVLSIATCRKLINLLLNKSGNDIDFVLNKHIRTVPVDHVLFKQLMLCTPFMVYKKGKNINMVKWLRDNLARYMVVDAAWFKKLMLEIHQRCNVPLELPRVVTKATGRVMHMSNDLSISSSYTLDPNIYHSMGDNIELSHEELSRMPAVCFPFWRAAYESGSAEYFEMYEVNGMLGHVFGGVYKEPTASKQVRSYDEVLSAARRKLPGRFSDDVKERYPEDFPPEEYSEEGSEEEEEEPVQETNGQQQQRAKRSRRSD